MRKEISWCGKMDIRNFFLAVHQGLPLTPRRRKLLTSFFGGDWEKVWESSERDLLSANIDSRGVKKFLEFRSTHTPEDTWDLMEKYEIRPIFYEDEEYPEPLKNTEQGPAVLFVKGSLLPEDFPAVSVVGARNMTHYGQSAVENIIGTIAKNGITIVSGLALGIDGQSHRTALKNNARTIAVLGNGLDTIYPETHRSLAEEIIRGNRGALISEFFPETPINDGNFPIRNKTIAGLSLATIVVEASQRSGSLITAQWALDFNREVFAVPGDISRPQSAGCHRLLDQGAGLAISGEKILEQLKIQNITIEKAQKKKLPTMGREAEILKLLEIGTPTDLDDLIRESGLSNTAVIPTITTLEMSGVLENIGNGKYVRKY